MKTKDNLNEWCKDHNGVTLDSGMSKFCAESKVSQSIRRLKGVRVMSWINQWTVVLSTTFMLLVCTILKVR